MFVNDGSIRVLMSISEQIRRFRCSQGLFKGITEEVLESYEEVPGSM